MMNYYLIIIKLILFPYILFSQEIISDEIQEKISYMDESDFLSIVIEINDDFNVLELKNDFNTNNTPVKKRASIICEIMQQIAKSSQTPIINIIKSNPSKYENMTSSWIINTIFIDAHISLIKELSNHPNIKHIRLQNTRGDIIDYIETQHNNSMPIEDGTEPGIEAINVRPLWEMGYTGKGLLVFNYDTGVWPEHPAFTDRFVANFYPMSQSWDGYFSNIPNGYVSDHGTHTLGTIAGLVAETNDTIGIAFKSYWIANDFVTSAVETLPPIEDMITSFEWALNPDGDTSTDYDVPDVINNSWRWYNEIDTFQCSGYAVELMNVIETAGIANIFSAGNNGPDNDGVRSPQRINTNLVNTFCVGSINANDENYPISYFSCQGPTQCPGEGSLAIYPEVVAPGQNVRSAWGTNGFNTISGTSMASPHVSGAVLLLKEAFPFLSGQEILLALYNTANDLGDIGEDNTFGMGIIDAYAAFNYLANSYEPIPANAITNDLVLLDISNIPGGISCESSFTPLMTILNNTDSIIDAVNIYYMDHLNDTEESLVNFEINLAPNNTIEIELPTITNTNFGDKEFSFHVTTIDSLIESDYYNNRKMVRYKYKPTIASLPYFEDFANGINNDNWHINNDDYSLTWEAISTGGLNTDNTSAYVNLYTYNPRAEQKDELISPNINLIGDSIALSFQVAYQKYNSSSKQDTLHILLSNDCGKNFNDTIFEKGGEDLSTYSTSTPDFIPQDNDQWREEIINLNDFESKEVMLKFVTTNLRGNNIFIDNINIYEANNNDLYEETLKISVHPNPSKGIFELSLNNCFIKTIRISNSLGQLIMEPHILNMRLNQHIVDLSDYNSGVYLIDIETLREHKTLQIIKN